MLQVLVPEVTSVPEPGRLSYRLAEIVWSLNWYCHSRVVHMLWWPSWRIIFRVMAELCWFLSGGRRESIDARKQVSMAVTWQYAARMLVHGHALIVAIPAEFTTLSFVKAQRVLVDLMMVRVWTAIYHGIKGQIIEVSWWYCSDKQTHLSMAKI